MFMLRLAMLGVATLTLPAMLSAQALDTTRLTAGQDVVVQAANGNALRGRVLDVSAASLTLRPSDGPDRTFAVDTIQRINRRDSTVEGFFIGLGAGVATAWAVRQQMCPNDPECGAIVSVYLGLPITAGGAALGALIDHLHQPLLFDAGESRRQVSVAPIVGRRTAGAMLSLAF